MSRRKSIWERNAGLTDDLDPAQETEEQEEQPYQPLWARGLDVDLGYEEPSTAAPSSTFNEEKAPPLNPDSETPHLDAFASMLGSKVEPVKDWWDNLTTIGGESLEGAKTSMIITDMMLSGGQDEDVNLVAEAILQDIKEGKDKPQVLKDLYAKIGEEGKKFDDAEGIVDSAIGFVDALSGSIYHAATNLEATSYAITESSAYSLPAMGGGVLGSRLGPVGVGAGVGLGTFAVEAGAHARELIMEKAAEQGIDVKDLTTDDVKAILGGQEFYDYMVDQGVKAGLTVAAVEAIFGRFAGRFAANSGNKFAGRVLDTTVEMTGEMAGEGAKSLTTDKEFVASDVISEGVFGLGQSVGTALIGESVQPVVNKFKKEDRQQRLDDLGNPIEDPNALPDDNEGLPLATEEQVDALDQQNEQVSEPIGMDPLPGENPNIAEDGSLNTSVEEVQSGDALNEELANEPETTQEPLQGDLFADEDTLQQAEPTGEPTDTTQDTAAAETVQEPVQDTEDASPAEDTETATPEPVQEDTQSGTETEVETETGDTADTVEWATDDNRIEQDNITELYNAPQDSEAVATDETGRVELREVGNEFEVFVDNEPTGERFETAEDAYSEMDTQAQMMEDRPVSTQETQTVETTETQQAQAFETDTDLNYEAITEPPLSHGGRIKVGHFFEEGAAGVGDQRFHVFVDNKVVRGKNGQPLVYKTLRGAEKRAERIANDGLPSQETTDASQQDTRTEAQQAQSEATQETTEQAAEVIPLKEIKITRTVTKADGTTAEMTGKAETIVRQYEKKADTYEQLMRCING